MPSAITLLSLFFLIASKAHPMPHPHPHPHRSHPHRRRRWHRRRHPEYRTYYGPEMWHSGFYPIQYADYDEYGGSCMSDGVKEVLFLSENCNGFATGPTCCDGNDSVVLQCRNLADDMSVGTVLCAPDLS